MKRVLFTLLVASVVVAPQVRAAYRGSIQVGDWSVLVEGPAAVRVALIDGNALVLVGHGMATVPAAPYSFSGTISNTVTQVVIEVDPPLNGPARITVVQGALWLEDRTPFTGDLRFVYDVPPGASGVNNPVSPGTRLEFEGSEPNPFATVTQFAYTLPYRGHVRLAVYDVAGHEVGVLVDDVQGTGRRTLAWDGRGERRSKQSPGVYFARLEFEGGMEVRKVVIAK